MNNPFPLRINEELMDKLRKMAEEHLRSVNKEIEYLIKQAVEDFEKEKQTISSK